AAGIRWRTPRRRSRRTWPWWPASSLQLDIDFAVHAESIAFQHVDGETKALEHHSAGGDHLKLQLGALGDGLHHRLQASVIRAVNQNDANLPARCATQGPPRQSVCSRPRRA